MTVFSGSSGCESAKVVHASNTEIPKPLLTKAATSLKTAHGYIYPHSAQRTRESLFLQSGHVATFTLLSWKYNHCLMQWSWKLWPQGSISTSELFVISSIQITQFVSLLFSELSVKSISISIFMNFSCLLKHLNQKSLSSKTSIALCCHRNYSKL